MSRTVVISRGAVSATVVRIKPNTLELLSVADFSPTTFALTSHHKHPLSDANCTAPHEYFSQIGTPSTVRASWRVKTRLFDAVPTNSLAVGIFA